MQKSNSINKAKQEITAFKRKLKIVQNDLIRAFEIAKPSPTESESYVLEQKEKRYQCMKKRLAEMERNLKVLQGEREPERIKPWTVRRPANESFLLAFVEA
ncbi:MAG: hypothetical protein WC180_03505 [Candidatus Paceibacterota bacterium]|jgi:hypothetical protein